MMTRMRMIHYGAPAAVLGGLLWVLISIAFYLTHGPGPANRMDTLFGLTLYDYGKFVVIPVLLFMLGLASLYAPQRMSSGWLGTVGLAVALAGYALMTIGIIVSSWPIAWGSYAISHTWPVVPTHHRYGGILISLSTLIVAIGSMLLAVAVLRDRVWPWWVVVPLVLGPLAALPWLHETRHGWFTGIAWMFIGYALWSARGPAGEGRAVRAEMREPYREIG